MKISPGRSPNHRDNGAAQGTVLLVMAILIDRITAGCTIPGTASPQKGSPSATVAPTPWTGSWDSDWGIMEFTQTGDKVTGTYPHDNGKIKGTVSGNTLTGTWSESRHTTLRKMQGMFSSPLPLTGNHSPVTGDMPPAPENGTATGKQPGNNYHFFLFLSVCPAGTTTTFSTLRSLCTWGMYSGTVARIGQKGNHHLACMQPYNPGYLLPVIPASPGTTGQRSQTARSPGLSAPRAGASRPGPGTGNPRRCRNRLPRYRPRSCLRPQKSPGIFLPCPHRSRQGLTVPFRPNASTISFAQLRVKTRACRGAAPRYRSWDRVQDRGISDKPPAFLCSKPLHGRGFERIVGGLDAGKRCSAVHGMLQFSREEGISAPFLCLGHEYRIKPAARRQRPAAPVF